MDTPGRTPSRTVLHEGRRTTVYLDQAEPKQTVIKVLNDPQPTIEELTRLRRELAMTCDLELRGIRRALRTDLVEGRHAIVLEYAPGQALNPRTARDTGDVLDFLRIALGATRLLGELHERGVIHRDIKPAHLIRDPNDGAVTLIDFAVASRLELQVSEDERPELVEGTLAYISPEQTGRTNRVVDWRSDLYSLGATFYALLAGRPPWVLDDPGELLHAHLARTAPRLNEVNPVVPGPVAEIVEKLLAKDAEERYQSARGLAHDLNRCLAALERGGHVEPFDLATRDASGRLRFPARLYGKESDVALLLDVFDRVREGKRRLALVAGDPGVGKSSLVHELDRPLGERGGMFVEGKFDELQRGVPYSALSQAFRQLVDTLLMEPPKAFARWCDAIGGGVGASSAALLPLVPNLDRLLGPLPLLGEAASTEVQNRFRTAARAFVRAVSSPDHPLVLFLDDLQWADMASLDVLRWILTDPDGGHLLVIGAYRGNEVPSGHPLHELVREARAAEVAEETLRLHDLEPADVRSLMADTLRVSREDVDELAALVHEKTRGNPFFSRRFVQSLEAEGLLWFDDDSLGWRWDVTAIAALDITDNVVELVAAQLGRLPREARHAVEAASCIGGRFDLSTLSAALALPLEELQRRLWPALGAGMILPLGRAARLGAEPEEGEDVSALSYAFVHDGVRQAAYDSLAPSARTAAHLAIGRSLLAEATAEQREDRVFEIVNHLDVAAGLVHDPEERRSLSALNLEAGRRAAAAAAYGSAAQYLTTGVTLLGKDAWSDAYDLALALESTLGESQYLAGALDDAERTSVETIGHARTALDAFAARETQVMVAYARDRQDLVLERGMEALRELGIRFPSSPSKASILADLVRTKMTLRGRTIESLAELPAMTDRATTMAMQMIERIIPAAFRSGDALFPLLVFRLVRLSVRRGNSPVSAFGYSTYAISLCGVLGDYDAGYRFALVGQRVAEQFNAPAFRSKSLFVFGNFVKHWKAPLRDCIEPLAESWRLGTESGSQFEAVWATFYRLLWRLQSGHDLADLEDDVDAMQGLLAQDVGAADAGRLLRQAVVNLRTPSEDCTRLAGPHYDETAMQARHSEATDQTHLCFYHTLKLQLAVWFGDVEEAQRHAEEAERRIEAVTSMPYVPVIRFYAALAAVDVLRAEPKSRALDRFAAKRARMLSRWAGRAPANYRHKYLLVDAERARATGDIRRAREAFEAAVSAARGSGLVQEEALVLERAAGFYLALGQDVLSLALVGEAARTWRHWGAHAKVRQLGREYPGLVALERGSAARSALDATGAAASVLDLAALSKASGAISRVGEHLLERLVEVAVESAGATRGALITARGEELTIATVYASAGEESEGGRGELVQRPLDADAPVCDAAVRLAARTRHALVIDDARTDARLRDQPWIAAGNARALLCVPIVRRDRLGGVLYLENTAAGFFTPDRVEILTVLGGEAAIALENARLFDAQKRFVPHEFLRSLDRADIAQVQLGDAVEKTMSVLFADMRGFSTLLEGLTPSESIRFINWYLGEMEPSITRYHGFVDEYQGDGILALFDTEPDDAVRAALDMIATLKTVNARRHQTGDPPIHTGIGIDTGRLILGTIGGETHLKAGVVGDTVNLSARIESLTKTYGVPLLVGGELVGSLVAPEDFALRPLDTVRVVGRTKPVTLYEVLDADPEPRRTAKLELSACWQDARERYRARDFAGARAALAEYLSGVPGDRAATTLEERCERYLTDPPPVDWDAVEDLQRK